MLRLVLQKYMVSASTIVETCCSRIIPQAPRLLKSWVMSIYLLSVSVGNLFTSAVNFVIQLFDTDGRVAGAGYFWLFAGLMLGMAALFTRVVARVDTPAKLQPDRPTVMPGT